MKPTGDRGSESREDSVALRGGIDVRSSFYSVQCEMRDAQLLVTSATLLVTSASLLATSALLVETKKLLI